MVLLVLRLKRNLLFPSITITIFSCKNSILILGIPLQIPVTLVRLAFAKTSADVEGLQEELSIHLEAAEGYDALKNNITLCKNSHKLE